MVSTQRIRAASKKETVTPRVAVRNDRTKEGGYVEIECQDCKGKKATQLSPFPLCDRCWTSRFSVQFVKGNQIPFRDLHKTNLKSMDLWRKDGESTSDWVKRCKTYSRKTGRTFK